MPASCVPRRSERSLYGRPRGTAPSRASARPSVSAAWIERRWRRRCARRARRGGGRRGWRRRARSSRSGPPPLAANSRCWARTSSYCCAARRLGARRPVDVAQQRQVVGRAGRGGGVSSSALGAAELAAGGGDLGQARRGRGGSRGLAQGAGGNVGSAASRRPCLKQHLAELDARPLECSRAGRTGGDGELHALRSRPRGRRGGTRAAGRAGVRGEIGPQVDHAAAGGPRPRRSGPARRARRRSTPSVGEGSATAGARLRAVGDGLDEAVLRAGRSTPGPSVAAGVVHIACSAAWKRVAGARCR